MEDACVNHVSRSVDKGASSSPKGESWLMDDIIHPLRPITIAPGRTVPAILVIPLLSSLHHRIASHDIPRCRLHFNQFILESYSTYQ